MATISSEKRQKIIAQALQEITFARNYKQGKTRNWKINENMYYSRKNDFDSTAVLPQFGSTSRANVDLGLMGSFVHTILSKIDKPLVFKYLKKKLSQLQRVIQLNGVRVNDQDKDFWDIKDIAGKKQCVIYGRTIFSYFADSIEGEYAAHLDPVDVYDFLIDPSAGGIDIERARYLGNYGIIKDRYELEQGIKSKIYLKDETTNLLAGGGNANEVNQEEINKQNRTYDTNVWTADKENTNPDKFKFWQWGTTFEGDRYYLLLSEKGATAIEVTLLSDKFKSGLWWYWTYAAFIDLTEFWTPSFCDYVREVFMAQETNIDQMLDNAEQINKPQKVVNVGAFENLLELKYRRDGIIKVKKDFDVQKAYQTIQVPSIDTPLRVYEKLDLIQEKASGVTAGAQGAADASADQTLGIYKGNEENSADRFGLFEKSYSFGYKRFAKLHEHGVREHLVKKQAIDILGPDGVEIIEVSRRDIFRKGETFGIGVESSNAEVALSEKEKQAKTGFLQFWANVPEVPGVPPAQNPKKAYEIMAGISGFDEETIRQLQDTSDYGDAEIMSEAERDIERILDGERFLPNQAANTAYKQRFVDYMQNEQEHLSQEEFTNLANYILSLDAIIERNMTRQANMILFKQQMKQILTPPPEVTGAPVAKKPVQLAPKIGGVPLIK